MKKIILFASLILLSQGIFAQFTACNSSTTEDLYDVAFVDQNIGVAVGGSGTIIRSTDGGLNWETIMTDAGVSFKKVKFFDASIGIAIGSAIYKTTDAGLTWTQVQHSNTSFGDIEILNPTTCLISGYPKALIKSTDQGTTFSDVVSEENDNLALLSFTDENIGYSSGAGGGPSAILKTTDGGQTWTEINDGSDFNPSVIEAFNFVAENTCFKGGWYNPTLKKSTDGAMSWNDVNYSNSTAPISLLDFHIEQSQPYAYYACGYAGQIFKSTDGGDNWGELTSGLSQTDILYGIFFIDDNTGWAVGGNGLIVKTTNGGGDLGTEVFTDNNSKPIAYPNPTEGVLNIAVGKADKIRKITLFSSAGKRIGSFKNKQEINIAGLSDGLYFLQMETNTGIQVEKIIKE